MNLRWCALGLLVAVTQAAWVGEEYWTTVGYDGSLKDGRTEADFLDIPNGEGGELRGWVGFWITRSKYGTHFESFGHVFRRDDGRICGWFVGYEREIVEACGGFRVLSKNRRNPHEPSPFQWIPASSATKGNTVGFHKHRVGKYSIPNGDVIIGDAILENQRKGVQAGFLGVDPRDTATGVVSVKAPEFSDRVWILQKNTPDVPPERTASYQGQEPSRQNIGNGAYPEQQRQPQPQHPQPHAIGQGAQPVHYQPHHAAGFNGHPIHREREQPGAHVYRTKDGSEFEPVQPQAQHRQPDVPATALDYQNVRQVDPSDQRLVDPRSNPEDSRYDPRFDPRTDKYDGRFNPYDPSYDPSTDPRYRQQFPNHAQPAPAQPQPQEHRDREVQAAPAADKPTEYQNVRQVDPSDQRLVDPRANPQDPRYDPRFDPRTDKYDGRFNPYDPAYDQSTDPRYRQHEHNAHPQQHRGNQQQDEENRRRAEEHRRVYEEQRQRHDIEARQREIMLREREERDRQEREQREQRERQRNGQQPQPQPQATLQQQQQPADVAPAQRSKELIPVKILRTGPVHGLNVVDRDGNLYQPIDQNGQQVFYPEDRRLPPFRNRMQLPPHQQTVHGADQRYDIPGYEKHRMHNVPKGTPQTADVQIGHGAAPAVPGAEAGAQIGQGAGWTPVEHQTIGHGAAPVEQGAGPSIGGGAGVQPVDQHSIGHGAAPVDQGAGHSIGGGAGVQPAEHHSIGHGAAPVDAGSIGGGAQPVSGPGAVGHGASVNATSAPSIGGGAQPVAGSGDQPKPLPIDDDDVDYQNLERPAPPRPAKAVTDSEEDM